MVPTRFSFLAFLIRDKTGRDGGKKLADGVDCVSARRSLYCKVLLLVYYKQLLHALFLIDVSVDAEAGSLNARCCRMGMPVEMGDASGSQIVSRPGWGGYAGHREVRYEEVGLCARWRYG